MTDLSGRRVLVTGAAAGIGRAIARDAAQAGAQVDALDIDASGLATLSGPGIETHIVDISDDTAIGEVLDSRPAYAGVVNSAGWVHHGNLETTSLEDWRKSFAINVDAMFLVLRRTVPDMIAAGGGAVVNIASVASSLKGYPARLAYGASKAAVIGMTKSIATEHVRDGLRCNAICPGTTDSPSLQERIADLGARMGGVEAARAAFIERQPMGRLGQPDEIASLALYLLDDRSAFLTGQALAIDGGILA